MWNALKLLKNGYKIHNRMHSWEKNNLGLLCFVYQLNQLYFVQFLRCVLWAVKYWVKVIGISVVLLVSTSDNILVACNLCWCRILNIETSYQGILNKKQMPFPSKKGEKTVKVIKIMWNPLFGCFSADPNLLFLFITRVPIKQWHTHIKARAMATGWSCVLHSIQVCLSH